MPKKQIPTEKLNRQDNISFQSTITWEKEKIGLLKTKNHPNPINYGCPPELGGKKDRITPEGLFLSSISACIASTALHLADRLHTNLTYLKTEASAIISPNNENKYEFSKINVKVEIQGTDDFLLERLCALVPEYCVITNAIKNKVRITFIGKQGKFYSVTRS